MLLVHRSICEWLRQHSSLLIYQTIFVTLESVLTQISGNRSAAWRSCGKNKRVVSTPQLIFKCQKSSQWLFFQKVAADWGLGFFSFSRWIASNQHFCFQSRFAKTAFSSKTFFTYHGNLRKCCSDKGASFVAQWLNTWLVIQRLWVQMLGFYSVGLFSDLGPLDRTIEKVSNPSLAIINECMLYG